MSSTTFRCAFCRLHRNHELPARPCRCHSGLDGLTESEIYSAIGTPAPTRARSTKKAPTRRRQQSQSPESDDGSPLQNRSTNLGTALATTSGFFSPSQGQELDRLAGTLDDGLDNFLVTHSNNHNPEAEIQAPEGPQQILSPASTQFIPETPLPQPRSRNSSIRIDFTNHIEALDNAQLRRSRNQMTTELEERTAQVDRLITRGRILEAEKIAQQAVIAQNQIELIQARLDAVEAGQRIQWKYVVALIVLIMVVGLYALWRAHNSEDFIYADQVRKSLFDGH